ncbi:MAG: sugar kinase [Acidobacteriota bacterium]
MTERLTENKIILITRRTRLDELIRRFNTEEQARFYVEHLGADFSDYQAEHRTYKAAARRTGRSLARLGRLQVVDRDFVPNFIFGETDTVVALGQDGLVANVMKYLDRQLLIGVNPDPVRWEGALLPFVVEELDELLPAVFAGESAVRRVTMARAELNTGEVLHGVNDLFIGPRSHFSARYELRFGDRTESQSSSGIIVSTGLGSTGWLRSILAGATGIAAAVTGQASATQHGAYEWDSEVLVFSVREPWPSKTSSAEVTFGRVSAEQPLTLVSRMPENGVIFSDGIEADFVQFNSGTSATISVAERKGRLVT